MNYHTNNYALWPASYIILCNYSLHRTGQPLHTSTTLTQHKLVLTAHIITVPPLPYIGTLWIARW